MSIKIDSREVMHGDIFFSLAKDRLQAEHHIKQAIENGASKVYSCFDIENAIKLDDIWGEMIKMLKSSYPLLPSKIMAVTGTNGKTSTAYFTWLMLRMLGMKCIYIGTIGVYIEDETDVSGKFSHVIGKNLSMPDITSLYEMLSIAKTQHDCDYAIIEATSHGIAQKRFDGIEIHSAGFTNLTQDHLDYHKTMENYFEAKKSLFTSLGKQKPIIVNIDDGYGKEVAKIDNDNIITYGKSNDCALRILSIEIFDRKQNVCFFYNGKIFNFKTILAGEFQIYNLICAVGFCLSLGIDVEKIVDILEIVRAPFGRLEEVIVNGCKTGVYVDYAHTPDALGKALIELRKTCDGSLFCVFGCGGDRDAAKRPLMAAVAAKFSDFLIITDDNPRTEDASKIRNDVIIGVVAEGMKDYIEISPREDAIRYAVNKMKQGDVVLIAGKGHEEYQIICHEKRYFSDKEEVIKAIESL